MSQETRELQRNEGQVPTESRRTRETLFVPRADVIEQKDGFLVLADMPGVDEKSVDIQVERNVLTISGRIEPQSFDGMQLSYQEYEQGRYERQFTLSDEVSTTGIEATVKNGVLEIHLPKAESARPRKITVNAR